LYRSDKRAAAAATADHSRAAGARRGARRWLLGSPALSLPFLLFLLLPMAALLLRASPARVLENLAEPVVAQAIWLSLYTSVAATAASILFGTPLAYLLARRRFRLKGLLNSLADLPIVLPPSVAGVALLMAFGRRGLLGPWLEAAGIHIAFTTLAVVIAQTFIAAPLYIRAASVGFAAVEPELEQSAALDGASRWGIFRHVTVPLSWMALLSGAVLAWARALGEFGATIIFAGNFPGRTQTMPLAIYIGFEIDLDVALTLSVILVGFSFAVLATLRGLLQRE
jgi:molybdate transport system permease protein